MPTGKVKWFDDVKGYGFIVPDDGGKDVFVHAKSVDKSGLESIGEGDHLSYEIEERTPGKFSAIKLQTVG
jgi:CspA family cold shock protein